MQKKEIIQEKYKAVVIAHVMMSFDCTMENGDEMKYFVFV